MPSVVPSQPAIPVATSAHATQSCDLTVRERIVGGGGADVGAGARAGNRVQVTARPAGVAPIRPNHTCRPRR